MDVVWLFCAPLWICGGCVLPLNEINNLIALRISTQEKDTKVAMRPCNSYDLPELEISRGQQHVIKAFDVAKPI